tara:strand:+ start:185 stop:1750 length:1566 start_codon:yes stop_codon:yes gene_type:complete
MIIKYKNMKKAVDEVVDDIQDFATGSQRLSCSFKIGNVVAETQSGKTGFLQKLAQSLYDLNNWRVFYTISHSGKKLNNQFNSDMAHIPSVTTFKLIHTKNEKHYKALLEQIKKIVKPNQVLVLGVDESEAGILVDSVLNKFIIKLVTDLPNSRIYMITTGATPASLRHLQDDLKIGIKSFRMKPGDGYVGLVEFSEKGWVKDTEHFDEDETLQPHSEVVAGFREQIKKSKHGFYSLRATARTKEQADNWGKFFETELHSDIIEDKAEVVTVYEDNALSIEEKLLHCEKESFFKNVVVIVVGSLTMGDRLYAKPEHKSKIKFIYDDSGKDMSVVQALPGRACGYYEPDEGGPMIFMRVSAIKEYEKVMDIDNSYDDISPTSSTALKGAKHIETNFTPCEIVKDYDITQYVEQSKTSKQIFDSFESLGYSTKNARYNSSDSKDFIGQWGNSEGDEPNYDVISGTWQGVKPFCLLIDRNNKIVRVVKKTGDRKKIRVKHNKSNETNKSLWNSPQFSNNAGVING